MNDDYRTTQYCPSIENIKEKKQHVVEMILADHPKAKDMHSYVSKNDGLYKLDFMEVYNSKCSYCGVSIGIIPKQMFEVDHFVNRKSFINKADAGFIENLVLACHSCNNSKNSFQIPVIDKELINPDSDKIKKTFKRTEDDYIVISPEFIDNVTVKSFYDKLKLGEEVHRIDYLLMDMIGLQRANSDDMQLYYELGAQIDMLRMKRNIS